MTYFGQRGRNKRDREPWTAPPNPHEFCTADDPSKLCAVCREMWDESVENAGQQKLPLEGK